jgi:hypothetical protein
MQLKKIEENINYNLEKIVLPDTNLLVGEEYPFDMGDIGAVLELLNGGFYFLKLVAEDIPDIIIEDFLENEVELKTVLNNDKVYLMIRFGDGDLLYEIFFDPTLYGQKERVKTDMKESNWVYTLLVDKKDKKIKAIKLINFPIDMFEKLTEAWEKALENPNYTEEYKEFCAAFFSHDIYYWWNEII